MGGRCHRNAHRQHEGNCHYNLWPCDNQIKTGPVAQIRHSCGFAGELRVEPHGRGGRAEFPVMLGLFAALALFVAFTIPAPAHAWPPVRLERLLRPLLGRTLVRPGLGWRNVVRRRLVLGAGR
jgi:hypothetical protein